MPAQKNSRDGTIYREELPDGCPPQDAKEIVDEIICYRLVHHEPPTEEDFRSQRALQPNKDFEVPECQARGLSVFMKPSDARKKARRSRNLRGTKVAKLTLTHGAGYIQKTGRNSHHTWWPYKECDVLANCEVME